MGFSSLVAAALAGGKAMITTIWLQVKDNEDDLHARVGAHDHTSGDDGALIDTSAIAVVAITRSRIAADAVSSSETELDPISTGSQAVGVSGGTWVPSEGIYMIAPTGGATLYLEIFVSSIWRRPPNIFTGGLIYADGANMRFVNVHISTVSTVYWQSF